MTSPAAPIPAATVMLLRDSAQGPEVLLLERHGGNDVLPEMYVFPGGRVEPRDLELIERLGGLTGAQAQALLPMVRTEWALGFFVAAIRETFEESGLLLAHERRSGAPPDAEMCRSIQSERLAVQANRSDFGALIRAHDLELDTRSLAVHAHWITPETVAHRFDTLFFAALAPAGQCAAHDGVESTAHAWVRPEDALSQARAGTRRIVFPTQCNLETLAGFERAEQVWEASRQRRVVTVLPRVEERDGQRRFVIPEEAGYATSSRRVPGSSP